MQHTDSPDMPFASRGWGLLMVVMATSVWAFSGITINFIIDRSGVTVLGLAFWRELATGAVLALGLAIFRPSLLRVARRDLPWLLLMGACMGYFHVLWNISVTTIGVSVATVVQANAPIFVTFMAYLLWREPLSWRKLAALALAIVGTVLIARPDRLEGMRVPPGGLLIALVAAIGYGVFTLLGKKMGRTYSPWTTLTYVFSFGALALLPAQIGTPLPRGLSPQVLGAFALFVLVITILGFALYTGSLQRLSASVAAIMGTAEVFFAAITSYLVLGERLDGVQAAGAVSVVLGVALVSVRRTAPAVTPTLSPSPAPQGRGGEGGGSSPSLSTNPDEWGL
jgi:drug/metabolite transporter (DMT)-like permease